MTARSQKRKQREGVSGEGKGTQGQKKKDRKRERKKQNRGRRGWLTRESIKGGKTKEREKDVGAKEKCVGRQTKKKQTGGRETPKKQADNLSVTKVIRNYVSERKNKGAPGPESPKCWLAAGKRGEVKNRTMLKEGVAWGHAIKLGRERVASKALIRPRTKLGRKHAGRQQRIPPGAQGRKVGRGNFDFKRERREGNPSQTPPGACRKKLRVKTHQITTVS